MDLVLTRGFLVVGVGGLISLCVVVGPVVLVVAVVVEVDVEVDVCVMVVEGVTVTEELNVVIVEFAVVEA